MGATNFHTTAFGKDAREAYAAAVQDALHWHGHGGYTGTIAEKSGFALVKLPPRVTSEKFLRWLDLTVHSMYVDYDRERLAQLEGSRAPRGQAEIRKQQKADLRKRIKQAEREVAAIPPQHLPLVQEAAEIWDDKWGPALALELTGAEATKAKANNGHKGTHAKVFVFCGMASC